MVCLLLWEIDIALAPRTIRTRQGKNELYAVMEWAIMSIRTMMVGTRFTSSFFALIPNECVCVFKPTIIGHIPGRCTDRLDFSHRDGNFLSLYHLHRKQSWRCPLVDGSTGSVRIDEPPALGHMCGVGYLCMPQSQRRSVWLTTSNGINHKLFCLAALCNGNCGVLVRTCCIRLPRVCRLNLTLDISETPVVNFV